MWSRLLSAMVIPSLLLVTPGAPVFASDGDEGHRDLEVEHRALMEALRAREAATAPPLRQPLRNDPPTGPRVVREVMGYLPYWSYSASEPYRPLRWDLLTILAWFSVEMEADGSIGNRRGWGGATTAAIVEEAHRHGVKVIITITNFDDDAIATIVGSAANRQRAIASCLSLMAEHDADGINIDFEFVPRAAKQDFVTFMTELKDAVRAVQPNGHEGHVSLAGPAVDWSGAYAYRALLENTDGIMVMAYGYHWSGGNPGPNSPLETGTLWRSRSISWTAEDYAEFGGEENLDKVLIGLPWYGRTWEVANTDIPGTKIGNGSAKFYRVAEPEAQAAGKSWEPISRSAWYHRTTGGKLYQAWYDDEASLTEKIAWIDARGLGGIGIWALGYEGDGPDLWDAIDVTIGPARPGAEPDPEPVEPSPEPAPEPTPEPGAEVEPTPDPTPEPGPEVGPEVMPEAAPLADAGPSVGPRGRTVDLRETAGPEGCAGGGAGGFGLVVVALVFAARRRVWTV